MGAGPGLTMLAVHIADTTHRELTIAAKVSGRTIRSIVETGIRKELELLSDGDEEVKDVLGALRRKVKR